MIKILLDSNLLISYSDKILPNYHKNYKVNFFTLFKDFKIHTYEKKKRRRKKEKKER
jgi:hypothetical protein